MEKLAGGDVRCYTCLENSLVVHQKVKRRINIYPAILLLDINQREMRTYF
jgi:hypothetical protein